MRFFIDKKFNKIINRVYVSRASAELSRVNSFISKNTVSKTKKDRFLE